MIQFYSGTYSIGTITDSTDTGTDNISTNTDGTVTGTDNTGTRTDNTDIHVYLHHTCLQSNAHNLESNRS